MHVFRTARALACAIFAFLLLPATLLAVQQGRISGRVTDGKGVALSDVKVTITTKAITNFKVELKTDKGGKYGTILNDATQTYHYRFEKEGFIPFEQDKKVPIGGSEVLDVELLTQQQAIEKGVVKQVEDPFTTSYNAAVEAYHAGDLEAAFAKAQEAIKLGPEKAIAYNLGATIALKKKDWDSTVALGEKSLALEPDNAPLVGMLMEAYRAKGDKAKALEYEKKYIAANPDQPEILYNQAVELYNKNDFKGAEPLLKKVVEGKPDFAKAHYLLGMSYVNLNKIPDMKKHLSEYLKLDPKGPDAAAAKEMIEAFK
ncbi:MAG TPA: tetratricopeptide repeat protein [Thermoanaerobaculia bacterium]|nr:tetratricopeptide repeat protein [Thermoanaerobaculia bacterium]